MRRIRAALKPRAHDGVVARVLAFVPQARAGDPQQRVEPVGASQELGANLYEPVRTCDVRELVRKDDMDTLLRPPVGVLRQQHLGRYDSPRDEERWMFALEERDAAFQPEGLRNVDQHLRPDARANGCGARSKTR